MVIGLFVIGVVVSGAIAWLGNWVGRTVGRRKLSLFGMRPRHTSTMVTVATGTFIFLATSLLLIAFSAPVRDMLLHQEEIKRQLSDAIHDLATVQSQSQRAGEEIKRLEAMRRISTPLLDMDQIVNLNVVDCRGGRDLIERQIDAMLTETNDKMLKL
ncbi:MAG TPA: DUF3084 domain-containing protein, partial [Candidatus Xenobia bacterium]